ncbi:uncharacterized protein LOC135134292 [Zophobas morio]|uniref:uncharacterized protein LOC135134292 n=1 Tax=Zophobas morio TaxID=2755281 RepID=UPI003083A851
MDISSLTDRLDSQSSSTHFMLKDKRAQSLHQLALLNPVDEESSQSEESVEIVSTLGAAIEINRAIAVFMITFKLLTYTAILIVVLKVDALIYEILDTTEEYAKHIGDIPRCIKTFVATCIIITCIVCLLGYYGNARLKLHLLAYYLFYLILMLAMCMFCFVVFSTTNPEDHDLATLFKNFSSNSRAKTAVYTLQKQYQCCGSKYHSSDTEKYQLSCCNTTTIDNSTKCIADQTFNNTCRTDKMTVLKAYAKVYDTRVRDAYISGFALIMCFEIFLTAHMMYYLRRRTRHDILLSSFK